LIYFRFTESLYIDIVATLVAAVNFPVNNNFVKIQLDIEMGFDILKIAFVFLFKPSTI